MASKSSLLTDVMQMGSILMCSCAMVMMLVEVGHLTIKKEQTTGGNIGSVCTRV